jgi:toxin HigB-1
MNVEFDDDDLASIETEIGFSGGMSQAIVKAFRKKMQFIRAAVDERDFYGMKSLRFEKLSGARNRQHSMRLNDQYRLIVELVGEGKEKVVRIVGIEDYH